MHEEPTMGQLSRRLAQIVASSPHVVPVVKDQTPAARPSVKPKKPKLAGRHK